MPDTEKKKVFVHPGFYPDNSRIKPVARSGFDFSNGTVTLRHMERDGNGVKIVEDGVEDRKALIQSEKVNAGLENIIRLQAMRYGTIENAIARNKEKQTFADVSKIPTSVAEQKEYIEKNEAEITALCQKLGISKEDLLKSTSESLAKLLADKAAASQEQANPGNEEGGNE